MQKWNLYMYMYELWLNYGIFLLWCTMLLLKIIQSYVYWYGLMFTIYCYLKKAVYNPLYDLAQMLILLEYFFLQITSHSTLSPVSVGATSLPYSLFFHPALIECQLCALCKSSFLNFYILMIYVYAPTRMGIPWRRIWFYLSLFPKIFWYLINVDWMNEREKKKITQWE